MGNVEIDGKQRVSLIHWHAKSCPDGTSKNGRPWKKDIATRAGFTQAMVTKLTKVVLQGGKLGISNETIKKLCSLDDEAFLGILGFRDKAVPTSKGSSAADQKWVMKFSQVASEDEYVDLCVEYNVAVHSWKNEDARKRAESKAKQHQEAAARWRTDDAAYWFEAHNARRRTESVDAPMHGHEIEAIGNLFRTLTSSESPSKTTIVHALPYSGIGHALQRILPACDGFDRYYRGGIHHLHIGALEYPYEARARLNKQLLNRSGDESDHYRSIAVEKKIANQLHSLDQLLVIHGASAIPENALSFVSRLSEELEIASVNQLRKGVSRLVLTVWEAGAFSYLNHRKPIIYDYSVNLSSAAAFKYFKEALEHYRLVRGKASQALVGPRGENAILKRTDHHYRGKGSAFTELPSAVRFRAFCASDTLNASPFDPTQGVWSRVDSEWRESIPEISDCLTDIQSDLRNFYIVGSSDDLLALRAVTTGLFFLTVDMLKNLKDHPISASITKNTTVTSHLQRKYVTFDSNDDGEFAGKYFAPLLVRSLVQDNWMRFEPTSRRKIHQAIAEILSKKISARDYDELHQEIPYQYPWGDSEVVLALETIRHFARAAMSAAESDAIDIIRKALGVYEKFLEPGTFSDIDIEASPQTAGKLSRSHGLHALKYEALCLLSADGKGLHAPVGASEGEQYAFFRELGMTLARMLRPHDAIYAFDRCLTLDCLTNFDRSYVLANAVSASILCGKLDRAYFFLNEARAIESQEKNGDTLKKIKGRNDARAAMFAFACGRRQEARSRWEQIADKGITPFQGDRSISYFDTFLASPITLKKDQDLADNLWASIERASHSALGQGFEHERLRIDIRKASLARILGFPTAAEAILDHVGLDLAKHSGAEMLFREFQIESANTLLSLGRPKYAFVAYAWPAFQSLRRKSARLLSRKSRNICVKLIREMDKGLNEPPPSSGSNKFWHEIDLTSHGNLYPLFSVDLLPASEDVERYFMELVDPEKRQLYVTILREQLPSELLPVSRTVT